MKIYELTETGYEAVEDILPQIIFQECNVSQNSIDDNELKLEYGLEMPFDINRAYFSILMQDIHRDIPCGTLFVLVPIGEDFDTIIYTVRFDEKEFKKIKKFS